MSDPQLRKDIAAMSLEIAELKKQNLELKNKPPKEVKVVEYVEKEVVRHYKCPKQAAIIRELQAKIGGR